MSSTRSRSLRKRLSFETLESRITPTVDIPVDPVDPLDPPPIVEQILPISVPNWTGAYQIYGPTVMNLLQNAVDPNVAAIDFSTINIVTPPTKGEVTVDPTTGAFSYTPNYLLPNGLAPGQEPQDILPDSFAFTVSDTLGAISNVATATFNGGVAPSKAGFLIAHDSGAVINTLQPAIIDIPSHLQELNDVRADLHTFALSSFDNPPQHGTLKYDPATGTLTYTPDFGYTGFDNIFYTVTDTTGVWHAYANIFIIVKSTIAPRLQSDPLGGQMLVVDGTSGNDTILVTPGQRHGDVIVNVNGVSSGPFHPTSRVVVFGYGGNDTIQVSDRVQIPAWLVGGNGNDTLTAGGGPSVLLGGIGNDILNSGRDRDLLIGGSGSDALNGTGNDILVVGSTTFDTNQAALNAVLREWNSNHSENQRIMNLTGQLNRKSARRKNGDIYFTPTTVQDLSIDAVELGGKKSFLVTVNESTNDIVINTPKSKSAPVSQTPNYRTGAVLAQANLETKGRGDKLSCRSH